MVAPPQVIQDHGRGDTGIERLGPSETRYGDPFSDKTLKARRYSVRLAANQDQTTPAKSDLMDMCPLQKSAVNRKAIF